MKNAIGIFLAIFICLPWVVLRFTLLSGHAAYEQHAILVAVLAGTSILAAAFLLSWAGEVAQMHISQALALSFLAFVAVLPEYSVDMYFSWMAGKDPSYQEYPVANMTGANRLLIGIGWPAVLLVYGLARRVKRMEMGSERRIEMGYLTLATLYSFVLPIKGTLSIVDAVVFVSLFVFYMRAASKAQHVEPEVLGPAKALAALSPGPRKVATIACFVFAGAVILLSAEPFAESLIATGRKYGISEFLLVQWLAPLASEAPEFIVALLFAARGLAGAGMGTLVSSKVNQWTLLIGLIPVVYSLSVGTAAALPLSARQSDELLLTSAQSAFAIAVIADLQMVWWEGLLLASLFVVQFAFHDTRGHHILTGVYLALTLLLILGSPSRRKNLWSLMSVLRNR